MRHLLPLAGRNRFPRIQRNGEECRHDQDHPPSHCAARRNPGRLRVGHPGLHSPTESATETGVRSSRLNGVTRTRHPAYTPEMVIP
jgi:hypothetical protein